LWQRITQEVREVTPLWWLCYRQSDRIEIAKVRGASLMHARLRAALDRIDADATFAEGPERAARVRPGYLGRMLSREEAAGLRQNRARSEIAGARQEALSGADRF
jgi:hypothetical protein